MPYFDNPTNEAKYSQIMDTFFSLDNNKEKEDFKNNLAYNMAALAINYPLANAAQNPEYQALQTILFIQRNTPKQT